MCKFSALQVGARGTREVDMGLAAPYPCPIALRGGPIRPSTGPRCLSGVERVLTLQEAIEQSHER